MAVSSNSTSPTPLWAEVELKDELARKLEHLGLEGRHTPRVVEHEHQVEGQPVGALGRTRTCRPGHGNAAQHFWLRRFWVPWPHLKNKFRLYINQNHIYQSE